MDFVRCGRGPSNGSAFEDMLGKADAATNLIIFSQVLIDFAAKENLEDAWGTFVEKRSNSPLFIMVLERYELKRWHLRHLTGVTWYVPPVTNNFIL